MRVGYLVHDLNDAAVARRTAMLVRGGSEVRLAGFRRGGAAPATIQGAPTLDLGATADGALKQRAAAVLRWSAWPGALARFFSCCDLLIGRNLETLALARRIVGGRPLVYECLDIHRSLLGSGPSNRAVQQVEAMMLSRVDLLLTSSPAFSREYFSKRPTLAAPTMLIENKLLQLSGDAPAHGQTPTNPPWVIGWFGMLRCRRTLSELIALAATMQGQVKILIAGKPSLAEFPTFEAEVGAAAHLTYLGPYRPEDLPSLYGRCHFAWAIDWFEEGLNSEWLLPNRLYEASAFGCVPIVLERMEVGRWLAAHDAGLRLRSGLEELIARLGSLDTEVYATMRQRLLSIPAEKLIAGPVDCRALVSRLVEVRHR